MPAPSVFAPSCSAQVRCSLPHLEALYADDPLWDLSAPRAACEAYIAAGEERCAESVQTGAHTQAVDGCSIVQPSYLVAAPEAPSVCLRPWCPTLQSAMSWGWTGQPIHSSCGA